LFVLGRHKGVVWSLALVDDDRIASGSIDVISVWELRFTYAQDFHPHPSNASKRIVGGSAVCLVSFSLSENTMCLQSITVPATLWSSAQSYLISGSTKGVRLWDISNGSHRTFPPVTSVCSLCYIPYGDGLIAVGSGSHQPMQIRSVFNNQSILSVSPDGMIWSLCLLPKTE